MLAHKKFANISIFSLIILVGISVFCEALVLPSLRISFSTSPKFTFSKWLVLFLLYFWIARMLGWFLYFKVALKTGSLLFSVTELFKLNFEILRFFTILERKLFKVSAVSDSREQRFYCFPKFLIIYNNFSHPNFGNFLLFSFFQERHTFISLIYIKLAGFFWVFFFFFS